MRTDSSQDFVISRGMQRMLLLHRERMVIGTMFLAFLLVVSNIIIVAPVLPFITSGFAVSGSGSFILVAFPFTAFFINLLAGPFVDHYSARRMIGIGALGCMLSFLLSAMASSEMLLVIGRVSTGIFMPLIGVSVFAYLAELFREEELVRAMGQVTVAGSVAQLIVPSLGVLACEYLTWRAPFASLAILSFVLFGSAMLLPNAEDQRGSAISFRSYFATMIAVAQYRAVVPIAAGYLLATVAMPAYQGLYTTWLLRQGMLPTQAAQLLLAAGVAAIFASSNAGRLARHVSSRTRLAAMLVLACAFAALLSVALPLSFAAQLFSYAMLSASMAVVIPVVRATIGDIVKKSERGTVNGLWNASYQLGFGAGGAASALLFRVDATFLLNGAVAAVLFVASAATFAVFAGDARSPRPGRGG